MATFQDYLGQPMVSQRLEIVRTVFYRLCALPRSQPCQSCEGIAVGSQIYMVEFPTVLFVSLYWSSDY